MNGDHEITAGDLVFRRLTVGPLATNCWAIIAHRDKRAVVIDPGDEPARIIDALNDVTVESILLTHSHFDHVMALPTVADAWGATISMHHEDKPVWPNELAFHQNHGHFDAGTATAELLATSCCQLSLVPHEPVWDGSTTTLTHGSTMLVGTTPITVLHTPGHTPGGLSFYAATAGHVFTGDTLFPGGPGLTGWPLSDFTTIIDSISNTLFALPDSTIVHPGHGHSTTIGRERSQLPAWIARGW